MRVNFTETGWNDYLYWQSQDKRTLKKINQIIQDIERNGHDGIGKPEQLKGDMSGLWSRRIDETNRFVYYIENDSLIITQCRSHYNDK